MLNDDMSFFSSKLLFRSAVLQKVIEIFNGSSEIQPGSSHIVYSTSESQHSDTSTSNTTEKSTEIPQQFEATFEDSSSTTYALEVFITLQKM